MAPPTPKKRIFKLDELAFYFDAVERDQLDTAGVSRRTAELLALRDGLLRLDDAAYDATMRAMRGLVDGALRPDFADGANPRHRRAQGRNLYETTKTAQLPSADKA